MGTGNYNAFSVKATRRFSKGLNVIASYTLGKSLDDTSGIRNQGNDELYPQNSECISCEYGVRAFDVKNRIVASALYELPIGPGETLPRRGNLGCGDRRLASRRDLYPPDRRSSDSTAQAPTTPVSLLRSATSTGPIQPGRAPTLSGTARTLNHCHEGRIDHLCTVAGERPRVAVLGDMFELGSAASGFHREVGRYAAAKGVRVLAVGVLSRDYLTAPGGTWYPTVEECLAALPQAIAPGSAILVKASRAMRLERIAEAILAPPAPSGPAAAPPTSPRRRPRSRPLRAPPRRRLPARRVSRPARHADRRRGALMFTALAAGITSMVVILIVGPWFIEWLRRNEFGQTIREEGPEGHKTKAGTPTMGGVLIWLAVLVPFFIFSQLSVASFSVLVIALGCASSALPTTG